mmetsp:Transcript_64805/g.76730  ORF Transcript_64805/g.76730 Transcript_64805/m.76730 type:complete len:90 (-) Transcript_64805:2175-2444(-)
MLVEIDIINNSGCYAELEPFCHGDVIYKRNNFCERYEKFKTGAIQRKDALRKMSINVGVFISNISESKPSGEKIEVIQNVIRVGSAFCV